jgi:HK97 gp10 family phage protein
MMDIEVHFEGLAELDEQLSKLSAAVAAKQVYGALSYATTPMMKKIKADAPKAAEAYFRYWKGGKKTGKGSKSKKERRLITPGILKKSIRRWRVKGLPDSYGIGLGVKKAKLEYIPFYWYFIENGTSKYAATPFIRPAFDTGKEDAVKRYMDKLRINIDKVIAKQALENPDMSGVDD